MDEEREQVAGRSIRPVQVLDDERDRGRRAEPAEQAAHALEDPDLEPARVIDARPVVGGSGQLGDEPGEVREAGTGGRGDPVGVDLAHERTERLCDRTERQPVVTERDRTTLEDEPVAGAQPRGSLRHEPALADARLAADQRERSVAGRSRIGRLHEHVQLYGAADEDGAGEASRHATDDRPCSFPLGRAGPDGGAWVRPWSSRSGQSSGGDRRRGGR